MCSLRVGFLYLQHFSFQKNHHKVDIFEFKCSNKIRVNGIAPGAIATNIASTMTNLSDFGNARIGAFSGLNPSVGPPEVIPCRSILGIR